MGEFDEHENYQRLALSIVLSGIKSKDISFLRSDWCTWLCQMGGLPFTGRHLLKRMLREGWWTMTWKDTERVLAKRLNGERVGNTGQATPDVTTSWLSIEVKERKALPMWLMDAVAQTVRNSDDGKLPIVVLHQKGCRHDNDLVLLRLCDFQDWFGDVV